MDYQGDIIRPPSEAFSILLQVTTGCSHNCCTFCGAYRDRCLRQQTLFLADGDALALPFEEMLWLLGRIRERLPWVRRVSSYATSANIAALTDEQLAALRQLGLGRLYLGLETGHDPTLRAIAKGADSAAMITAGQRVRAAGMFLSVTCLLGIAGRESSLAHARATAEVLTRMQPHQVAVLTLMVLPNTPIYRQMRAGRFDLPDQAGLFAELRCLLTSLGPIRTQFSANHASNALALEGRLPRDRERLLTLIDRAAAGTLPLRPKHLRGL